MIEVKTTPDLPVLAGKLGQLQAQLQTLLQAGADEDPRFWDYTRRFTEQVIADLQTITVADPPASSPALQVPIHVQSKRAPRESQVVESALLTFKEAMSYLRVSRSTLYRLLRSGQLTGQKVSNTWRFTRAALDSCVVAAKAGKTDNENKTGGQEP